MRAGVTLTRACQIVITDFGSQVEKMSLWLEMAGYYQYRRQNPIRTVLSRKKLRKKPYIFYNRPGTPDLIGNTMDNLNPTF